MLHGPKSELPLAKGTEQDKKGLGTQNAVTMQNASKKPGTKKKKKNQKKKKKIKNQNLRLFSAGLQKLDTASNRLLQGPQRDKFCLNRLG